jgi:hypothetical protein
MEVSIVELKRKAQQFLSDDKLTELEVYEVLSNDNGLKYTANIDIAELEFNVLFYYSDIVNYIEKNYPTRINKYWGEEYSCIVETDDQGNEIYCIPIDVYFAENSLLIVKDLLTLILK